MSRTRSLSERFKRIRTSAEVGHELEKVPNFLPDAHADLLRKVHNAQLHAGGLAGLINPLHFKVIKE